MAKNNFDDLKSTLLNTFNFVAEKVLDLADTAADTAKTGHEIAKLLIEKKKAETYLEDTYVQMGKLYYDLHKDDADGVFGDLCGEIADTLETLENIENEISELKENMSGELDDIEVEFSEFFDDADFESVVKQAESEAEVSLDPPADPSAGIADEPDAN